MRRLAACSATACLVVLTACANDDDSPETTDPPTTPPAQTSVSEETTTEPSPSPPAPTDESGAGPVAPTDVETITGGLDVPWDIAFISDDEALVSERNTARILSVTAGGEVSEIGVVDGVEPGGEGGLQGIAVHEDWLYAYYTAASDNRVVRMPFDGTSLGDQEVIIDGIPKAGIHNGGRIRFGPDGLLYVSTGDASTSGRSQDTDSLAGKILRLNPDGSVPDGNPFGSPVWTYGHRNPQGLAWDDDGNLWASEFGQNTWDELNLIEAGNNYGWPTVEGMAGEDDLTDPVLQWATREASPSGITYVRNTVFMAALRGQTLWQIPVAGGEAGEPVPFYTQDYGRMRHAELAPDGSLWVLTNNTDTRCRADGDPPCTAPTDEDFVLRVTLSQ